MASFPVLNEDTFSAQTKSGLVAVDFYAVWCGPCKMLNPILEEVAREAQSKVKFVKVDVDESQTLTAKFKVTAMPTVVFLKDGKEVDRFVGVRDKDFILDIIDSH